MTLDNGRMHQWRAASRLTSYSIKRPIARPSRSDCSVPYTCPRCDYWTTDDAAAWYHDDQCRKTQNDKHDGRL
jgi:hypothetical protein